MKPTILNREFQHPADGWYQIEPKGEHPNRPAGIVQVIDDEAATAIVNRFNADAAAGTLRHGHEMLIDHEHFASDADKESRAYGWLAELQNREDGIYGRVRWTTTGKAAVDGGDYRFWSTEYDPSDLVPVKNRTNAANASKGTYVRPTRLDGLSLTNMNNNLGQRPITNRGQSNDLRRGADASAAGKQEKQNQRTMMKSVATKLGLSAEASEEAVLAAVTSVMNRAETAEASLGPAKNRVTELETTNQGLMTEQVDALLDAHGVKEEKVRNRLKPVLGALKNRQERIDALGDFGFKLGEVNPAATTQQRKLHNRDTKAPDDAGGAGDTAAENARVIKIQNRACELQKQMPTLSTATAYTMAGREIS